MDREKSLESSHLEEGGFHVVAHELVFVFFAADSVCKVHFGMQIGVERDTREKRSLVEYFFLHNVRVTEEICGSSQGGCQDQLDVTHIPTRPQSFTRNPPFDA